MCSASHDNMKYENGRGGRTRTLDIWFWRPTFCQLNYTPIAVSYTHLLFSSKYNTCHSIIERFAGKDNDIFLKISGNTKQINPLWQNKWRISPVPPFFPSCLWDNFAYWRKISFHKNGWYSHRSSHIRKAIKARWAKEEYQPHKEKGTLQPIPSGYFFAAWFSILLV